MNGVLALLGSAVLPLKEVPRYRSSVFPTNPAYRNRKTFQWVRRDVKSKRFRGVVYPVNSPLLNPDLIGPRRRRTRSHCE